MKAYSMVAVGTAVLLISGCSADTVANPDPGASGPSLPTPRSSAPSVTAAAVPTSLPGQIAYATLAADGTLEQVSVAEAEPETAYSLSGICVPDPFVSGLVSVRYEVRSDKGSFISAGEIPCQGRMQRDTALVAGSSGRVRVTFSGPLTGVGDLFAAIVPD